MASTEPTTASVATICLSKKTGAAMAAQFVA